MKFPYKAAIVTVLVLTIFLGMFNIYKSFFKKVKTQIITEGTIENVISTNGYIIKDETILFDDEGKVVSSFVSDGQKVSRGHAVATVFESSVDRETRAKLKDINEKISNMSALILRGDLGSDEYRANSIIKSQIAQMIEYSHKGQGYKLVEVKSELEDAIDSRIASDIDSANNALNKLKAEKEKIESEIVGEKKTLYSDKSGLYFSKLDGYENIVTVDKIKELTPDMLSDFEKLKKDKSASLGSSAKISDSYIWYYAAIVDTKKITGLTKGEKVYLSLRDFSDDRIDANVYFISGDYNGKSVLVCSADVYNSYIYLNSKINIDIITNRSTGFMVSKSAIKVVNGETGIYVVKNDKYKFKKVEIIASDDKNVIIRRESNGYETSLLYDEAVIKGEVKIEQEAE